MVRVSQLVHEEVGAKCIGHESTTCLRSQGFWDPPPYGRQLCNPNMVHTLVINH